MQPLNAAQIESFCRDYFGSKGCLQTYQLLSGSEVNITYKIIWNEEPYVLRFYVRDPRVAQVEQEVFRLIHEKVPVPDLLYIDPSMRPFPFAIFQFVSKKHIFEFKSDAEEISYALGNVLSNIHSFHFSQAGLFGDGLKISTLFEEESSPYFTYCMEHLNPTSLVWKRLGSERATKLKNFLKEQQDFFPIIHGGGVLVHSDFKPVNLLWGAQDGLTVLDWEFAHSGHPLLDLAVLLRHFREFPFRIESFEKGYEENGSKLPEGWIQKARLTDAINLIQLLNTSAERPHLFKSLLQSIDSLSNSFSPFKQFPF